MPMLKGIYKYIYLTVISWPRGLKKKNCLKVMHYVAVLSKELLETFILVLVSSKIGGKSILGHLTNKGITDWTSVFGVLFLYSTVLIT